MSELSVKFYSRYEISFQDLEEMHMIFSKYYKNTELKTFKNDLDKKNGAFILRKRSTGEIVGFSTLLEMRMIINGKKVFGVFSGDTIVEEEYWGKNPLTSAFVWYYMKKLFANPFRPVYWFLISKGYKTYLLLTNNFLNYYPCYNKENQHLEDIMAGYCNYLFPEYFNEKKKVLDFGKGSQSLKGGVAEITSEMCSKYPKIAFFNERNPNWDLGTELPCVGEMTWGTILNRVFVKPIVKQGRKLSSFLFPGKEEQRISSRRKAMP
jgi:hypothetical protein